MTPSDREMTGRIRIGSLVSFENKAYRIVGIVTTHPYVAKHNPFTSIVDIFWCNPNTEIGVEVGLLTDFYCSWFEIDKQHYKLIEE